MGESQINIVAHIRRNDSPSWRRYPIAYYVKVIDEIESMCTGEVPLAGTTWCTALTNRFLMKRNTTRHFWVHTDDDAIRIEQELRRNLTLGAGSILHVIGKHDISVLHAM